VPEGTPVAAVWFGGGTGTATGGIGASFAGATVLTRAVLPAAADGDTGPEGAVDGVGAGAGLPFDADGTAFVFAGTNSVRACAN